jgi:Flp pilus assembly protein TadD
MRNFRIIWPAMALLLSVLAPLAQGKEKPLTAREHNALGMELLEKNDNAAACRHFEAALILDPSVKYYHNNCAAACMRQGKYAEARRHLDDCLILDPGYPKALSNMAVAVFHLGQYRLAYRYYRLAMEADRSYSQRRFERQSILHEMKKKAVLYPEDGDLSRIIRHLESQ